MSAQIATMNDVANMPTRNCGKYIMAQHPMFRRFRRLSNRQLKSPPLHFAKRRAPIAPRSPGAMDAPGIADSAIAVPDTATHYWTPMPMAQDRIAD